MDEQDSQGPKKLADTMPFSQRPQALSETKSDPQKNATIAVLLAKLAVHYYRPNFTENQAKSLIGDLVEDICEFSVAQIEVAIRQYRQAASSKYFPTSGQLREILFANKKHADEMATKWVGSEGKPLVPQFGESRPHFWWMKPRQLWQVHWREDEIPEEHAAMFQRRKERMAMKEAAE